MGQKKIIILMVSMALVCVASDFQNTSDHRVLFEKAKFAMETKGDIQGAIKLFREIVAKYPQEKEYAARAQFYIGACYEKLGNVEAIKAYELVLQKYADQPELVVAARERLAALRRGKPSAGEIETLHPAEGIFDAQSLSPDGTRVAIVDYSKGQNIAVYDIATKRTDLITQYDWHSQDSGWTYLPVWSPDGKELAYVFGTYYKKPAATELRVAGLDGKSRLLLSVEGDDYVAPLGWLRDGSAIISRAIKNKVATLGLISPLGGEFKPLRVIKGEYADSSPEGRWIVFEDVAEGESHDIFTISRDGNIVETLTDHPSDDRMPRWSPDGKHIVFLSERHGDWALWAVAVNEGKPAGDPFMVKSGMENASLLDWTPSGLAIQSAIFMNDVYVLPVNPATGEPSIKAQLMSYPVTGINTSPVWSPDGMSLAFASIAWGKPDSGQIVVLPLDGSGPKKYPIPSAKAANFQLYDLRWLPDSSGLGFTSFDNSGTWSAFQLTLKAGEWKTWPILGEWPHSEWGGNGIYFYCRLGQGGEPSTIVERNLEAGIERVLYKVENTESGWTGFKELKFSRDRKWLGFEESGTGGTKLIVVDIQSGKSRILAEDPLGLGGPAWSPDGNFVLDLGISAQGKRYDTMQVFSLQDGSVKKYPIAMLFPKNAEVSSPDWSLDGKQIAFRVRFLRFELLRMKSVIGEKR